MIKISYLSVDNSFVRATPHTSIQFEERITGGGVAVLYLEKRGEG